MDCPYLVKHNRYYSCKASSELIGKHGIAGRICLSEEFKECYEYKYSKVQEKIKVVQTFKKEGKNCA